MQRFTVVSHSNDSTARAPAVAKKASTDFLRNIVKSNIQRSATVQGFDVPSTTPAKSSAPQTAKISFGNDQISTFSATSRPAASSPSPSQTKTAIKSAMKKTTHAIPIAREIIDLISDPSDLPSAKSKPQSSSHTSAQSTSSSKPLNKASQNDSKTGQKGITKTSQQNDKPAKKAMTGFLSAIDLDEYQSSNAIKRKQLLATGPSNLYDTKTGKFVKNTPESLKKTQSQHTSTSSKSTKPSQPSQPLKKQKISPIDSKVTKTEPKPFPTKSKGVGFMSASEVNFEDLSDYSSHSDEFSDNSENDLEYQEALAMMNAGDSRKPSTENKFDSKNIKLDSKSSKLHPSSKVQLKPLSKPQVAPNMKGKPGKAGKPAVDSEEEEEEEEEFDGFLDHSDHFDDVSEEEPPQKLKQSANIPQKIKPGVQIFKQISKTPQCGKKAMKPVASESEDEADGFLDDSDDDFAHNHVDSDDEGVQDDESEEFDGFLSESDDDSFAPPPKALKGKASVVASRIDPKIVGKNAKAMKDVKSGAKSVEYDDVDRPQNSALQFHGVDVVYETTPLITQPDIPTTAKIAITVYFPQQQQQQKQLHTQTPPSTTIAVKCYDLETYQNSLHTLLNYPAVNPPTQSFYYTLQSEVHSRFLYPFMPAPIVPRHNLIARSSSLHNANNLYLINLFNEELVRRQHSSILYTKFNQTFPKLKDNTFNNYEQWAIRNLSIKDSMLPKSLTSFDHRTKLFQILASGKLSPQSLMPPTQFNPHQLHTAKSRQTQKQSQILLAQQFQSQQHGKVPKQSYEIDLLLGSAQQTCNDSELRAQLGTRGLTADQIAEGMAAYQKSVQHAVDEIKHAQHVFQSKGAPPKDSIVKVTEDINKSTMNQDIAVLYDHIREFDKISITFHTAIGSVHLSIPHCVKLIIFYISNMILNYCLDDVIITKILQLSPHNDKLSPELQHHELKQHDFRLLDDIISMAAPQLHANFTPLRTATTTTTLSSKFTSQIISDHQEDEFSAYYQGNDEEAQPTFSPRLTQQIATILTRIQDKLPPQSIISQYISMLITGFIVTPKIPNLKISTTPIHAFPTALAHAIVLTLFRYDGLHGSHHKSGGGNQAAVPPRFLQQCNSLLNINMEAFASPLNAYFNTYCSAFADTDTPFGSLGSFFHFTPQSGCIFVNPPFASNTILASIIHAEQLLAYSERSDAYETPLSRLINGQKNTQLNNSTHFTTTANNGGTNNDGLMFMFVFPHKDDELYTEWIKTSPFCTMYTILPARSHIYTVGRQETNVNKKQCYRPARHDSILVTLQNKSSQTRQPINETIIKDLLKYFLVHNPPKEKGGKGEEV